MGLRFIGLHVEGLEFRASNCIERHNIRILVNGNSHRNSSTTIKNCRNNGISTSNSVYGSNFNSLGLVL